MAVWTILLCTATGAFSTWGPTEDLSEAHTIGTTASTILRPTDFTASRLGLVEDTLVLWIEQGRSANASAGVPLEIAGKLEEAGCVLESWLASAFPGDCVPIAEELLSFMRAAVAKESNMKTSRETAGHPGLRVGFGFSETQDADSHAPHPWSNSLDLGRVAALALSNDRFGDACRAVEEFAASTESICREGLDPTQVVSLIRVTSVLHEQIVAWYPGTSDSESFLLNTKHLNELRHNAQSILRSLHSRLKATWLLETQKNSPDLCKQQAMAWIDETVSKSGCGSLLDACTFFVRQFPEDRKSADYHYQIGEIQEENDNTREAMASYRRVIELFPESDAAEKAALKLALLLMYLDRPREALEHLVHRLPGLKSGEYIAHAYFILAQCEARVGRFDSCDARIKYLLQSAPSSPITAGAAFWLAREKISAGAYPAAAEILRQILLVAPESLPGIRARHLLPVLENGDIEK